MKEDAESHLTKRQLSMERRMHHCYSSYERNVDAVVVVELGVAAVVVGVGAVVRLQMNNQTLLASFHC